MGEKKKKAGKNKDAQLIIRVSKEERKAFVDLCESIDTTAAREIRHFMRQFVADRQGADEQES
ncbi:MAG: hypothetical protein M0Q95_07720 [Porticoccaceae bacterium]|nr:hypothetical protein [Porticoccaceae bacterium]